MPPYPNPNPHQGSHPGVSCDKSGQCPIVGWRFKLTGQNYDLCEAEFNKLPDAEKRRYEKIAAPSSEFIILGAAPDSEVAPRSEVAVHAWRSPTPSSAGGEGRVCDAGMWPARQRQSGPAMQKPTLPRLVDVRR